MTKRFKTQIAVILILSLFTAILAPQTTAAASPELSMEDFEYSDSGNQISFTQNDQPGGCVFALTDKSSKTHRGITVGSKLSDVQKKYGDNQIKNFDNKESFNRYIRTYNKIHFYFDTAKWSTYLEYIYKENTEEDRRLRFYFNRKEKVAACVYIYGYKNFYLTKKKANIGISFRAPKGQKITTKKIAGKKVKVLPASSKITYKKSKLPEFGILGQIYMYDDKGKICGGSLIPINFHWVGKSIKTVEDLLDDMCKIKPGTWNYQGKLNLKKPGKYNYFELTVYDLDETDGYDIPTRYYFRLK